MAGVYLDGEGKVLLIRHFDHSGHPDKIYLLGKTESADYWTPGENDGIDIGGSQVGGNGQSSTNVAEAIGVVGVHQNIIGGLAGHSYFQSNLRWWSGTNAFGIFPRPSHFILWNTATLLDKP